MAQAPDSADGMRRRAPSAGRVIAIATITMGLISSCAGAWRGIVSFNAAAFVGESSAGYGPVTNGSLSRFGVGAAILEQPLTILGLLGVFLGVLVFAYIAGASRRADSRES